MKELCGDHLYPWFCRGGGEYGIDWRKEGSLENKQNVFDDFQACAEYLISAKYCSPATLAIQARILSHHIHQILSLCSIYCATQTI